MQCCHTWENWAKTESATVDNQAADLWKSKNTENLKNTTWQTEKLIKIKCDI